ncbi:hypothetical protein ACFVX4_41935, partial [Streptomyces sp. NPDC058240]
SGEYLLGGATSSSFPSQGDPIGSLSGNFEAPQYLVERPLPGADAGGLHLRDEVLHRPHDEGAPEQGRGIASKGSSTEPRPRLIPARKQAATEPAAR